MIRYYSPYDGTRFLANKKSKEIHDLENESSMCHIDKINENNFIMVDQESDVVDMCNYDGYNGCYWCLSRYNDEHLY